MAAEPLVSVVTPCHNTAPYLDECIQSVLDQTYTNFEYVVVDNCSTDGSGEIAARYADKDARVRVVEPGRFLTQTDNYNFALSQVDAASSYVKIVQADDVIRPSCIADMVAVAETDPAIGLVSSYYLVGDRLFGDGVAQSDRVVPGREVCRRMLSVDYPLRRGNAARGWLTGSPTTLLYRADIVRSRVPFFEQSVYFNDTFAAFEILLDHDLGFVHEVLSWSRDENAGISSAIWEFEPDLVQCVMLLARYGRRLMSADDLVECTREAERVYYRRLARHALRFARRRFWAFHRDQLRVVDKTLRPGRLLAYAAVELARALLDGSASPVTRGGRRAMNHDMTVRHASNER